MSANEKSVAAMSTSASASSAASANAAMSVFHSFHAVGDEISSLQKQRREAEADTRAKQLEMRRLREEMAKMDKAKRAASIQHGEWTRKLQELHLEEPTTERATTSSTTSASTASNTASSNAESAAAQAAEAAGLSNRVKLGQLERLIRDARENFLRESLEFRRECARLRVRAASLGLPEASTVAFLAVHGIDVSDAGDGEGGGGSPDDDADDLDDDPALWKHVDLDDEETKGLWEAYQKSRDRLAALEKESGALDASLDEWKTKSASRKERVEHLESQLRRVASENDGLEAKVKELQDMASAATTTTTTTAQPQPMNLSEETRFDDAVPSPPPSKKARAADPRPPQAAALRPTQGAPKLAVNPYAKNTKKAPPPVAASRPAAHGAATGSARAAAASDAGNDRRRELRSVVVGPVASKSNHGSAAASTTSRNYRERRDEGGSRPRSRRRDRQFGCSLVVQDGTTLDASWDDQFTPSPPRDGRTTLPATSSREEEASRGANTASITPADPPGRSDPGTGSSKNTLVSKGLDVLAHDDDDDDDDDFLSRSLWAPPSGRK